MSGCYFGGYTVMHKGIEYIECKAADCRYIHLVVDGRTYAEWRHPAPVVSPFVRNAMAGRLPVKEYAR